MPNSESRHEPSSLRRDYAPLFGRTVAFFGWVSAFSAVFVCSYQALAATSRWVDKADNPYHCTHHSYDKQNAC
jgi:hypothetical protein